MKIDLLNPQAERNARRITLIVAAVFTLVVGSLASLGAGLSYRAATHGTNVLVEVGQMLSLGSLQSLAFGGGTTTDDPFATPDNRINILLLGVGGDGHDGPELTDTIILVSLDRQNKRIGLLSIPRDMAYPLGNGRFQKINAVNAYAEKQSPGRGAKLTAEAFHKLLDVRIDRVIRIDFKGFEKFIDALGGIDINVERAFSDNSFPTDDTGPNPYKWTSVSFQKGWQHMDGARALIYVRSRHGTNGEGSDFARSRRQQLVLEALRTKLFSLGTLTNPKKVTDLWSSLSSNIQTDLTAWDALKLLPLAASFKDTTIKTRVLTDAIDGELVSANVEGSFMLFPRKPDWSEIRAAAADPFTTKEEIAQQSRPGEHINLEIKNGTLRTGFASQVSAKLESLGYSVEATGNATKRGYEKTVIYDLTNGSKPQELAKLKKLLDANVVETTAGPGKTVQTDSQAHENLYTTATHFLVILGDSSFGLVNPYGNY
jgi:LCP family protein required for cell wall assembly